MAARRTDLGGVTGLLRRLPTEAQALMTIIQSGMVGPERADRLIGIYRALERYGAMGAAVSVAAIRHGRRTAVVDELGSLTFEEMDRR